jgi:hypothetical protein
MKKLTDYQKEFLLTYFFKNEVYPNWKNIATKLLENGSCIVAGERCIWHGGIGNFIKTKVANNAIGCLLYEFDLEYFLSSAWKEIRICYIAELSSKKRGIETELNDICDLKITLLFSFYLNN